jgi:hypothetical protein
VEASASTTAVFVSGIEDWEPREDEWLAIESWLSSGVPVMVETTGGRGGFSRTFRLAATARYGVKTEAVDSRDPLFGARLPEDLDMERTGWLPESLTRFGVGTHPHHLERVRTQHPGMLMIAEFDLTHAMLGNQATGVHGWRTPWVDSFLERLLRSRNDHQIPAP